MNKKKKIILFDFDGVIADSFLIAFEVNKIIDPNIVSEADYRKLFDGNVGERVKKSLKEEEWDKLSKKFFEIYNPRMKNVKIFPGMRNVVAKLEKKI